MNGPLSLYPLLRDGTLRNAAPMFREGPEAEFFPHFKAFEWNKTHATESAMGLVDLGDSLIETITKAVILDPFYSSSLIQKLIPGHGLDNKTDLMTIGIEKILIPLLWFCNTPGIVGFTYSHVFSTVNEPNTCCLIASTASSLLKPCQSSSDVSLALSLTKGLCEVLEGQVSLGVVEELITEPLEAAECENKSLVLEAVRLWIRSKYDDMVRGLDAVESEADEKEHKKEVLEGRFEVCWDVLCYSLFLSLVDSITLCLSTNRKRSSKR